MRAYNVQKFESDKSVEEVWKLLANNKHLLAQELRQSVLLTIGGFRIRISEKKHQAKICRLNPFWYYTVLNVTPIAKGSLLEIKSVPQPFYDWIFLGLLTVLLSMVAYSTRNILVLIAYAAILLLGLINLEVKYRIFYMLTGFCKKISISE